MLVVVRFGGVCLCAALLAGCVSETTQTVRTPPVLVGRYQSAPVGPRYVTVVLSAAEGVTRAEVGIARNCRLIDRSEARAYSERTVSPTIAGYLGPGVLILFGSFLALPTRQNSGGQPGAGILVALAGVGAYVAIGAKSGSEKTPLPPREDERPVAIVQCHVVPAADVEIEIRGRQAALLGHTDRNGVALMQGDFHALGRAQAVFIDGSLVTQVTQRDDAPAPGIPPAPPAPPRAAPTPSNDPAPPEQAPPTGVLPPE